MIRQLHGRLTDEQVGAILSRYVQRELSTEQAMGMLELGRSQFFEWVKKYKRGLPSDFSTGYSRKTPNYRISNELEEHVLDELKMEKTLIDDPSMPVKYYNYSFVKDQILKKYKQDVSLPTIIDRAKKTAFTARSPKGNIMIGR
jgi:hypothetical protein